LGLVVDAIIWNNSNGFLIRQQPHRACSSFALGITRRLI
jgi:hypothetical protein